MKTIFAGVQDELPADNGGGSRPSRGGYYHQERCPIASHYPPMSRNRMSSAAWPEPLRSAVTLKRR
jgi:hypothetical protein